MKKLFLFIIIVISSTEGISQTTITIKSLGLMIWNTNTETFDSFGDAVFDNSVFIVNENVDQVIHKTSEGITTYYLSNNKFDDGIVVSDGISDTGVEYTIIFDFDKSQIKLLGNYEGQIILLLYGIKAVF